MEWLLSVPIAVRYAATFGFIAILVALSISPGTEKDQDSVFGWIVVHTPTPVQKVMHVAMYSVLAILCLWTLEPVESAITRFVLAFSLAVTLGAALEWYQTHVPGRFGTLMDSLLNFCGALLGLLASSIFL